MENLAQKEWVVNVDDELKQMKDDSMQEMELHWKKRSIYQLPAWVVDLNRKAYKPQSVSFGPYHHGQAHLKPMEENKLRALLHFLKRSNKTLEFFVEFLRPLVQDLKDSYDSLDDTWKNDTESFLHMMILDGCFVLEILRVAASISADVHNPTWSSIHRTDSTNDADTIDYASNDPIFSSHGKLYIMPYIKRDMLMIENQLPMLLLYNLFLAQNDKTKHEESLNDLILKFFFPNAHVTSMEKCLHILDVYRKSLLSEIQVEHRRHHHMVYEEGDEIIRSATELNEAGIRFKKSKTGSLKDISFDDGILRLPPIVVDDATESMFLNLIAFERFHVGAGNEVTSYIFFMDNIIDSAKDVSLLHSKGIIQNALGSDKAVAKLFNSLSKDITLDPESSLDAVHKSVHYYCKKPWNEWRANLIHTYFRNPWASLSVFAAIILFALTIIQTVYTVLQY